VLEGKPDYTNDISNINKSITNLNDNMSSVLYMLDSIQNTHIKDELRNIGFRIEDLRNVMSERITLFERKLEENDNTLADILSRLTAAGI
jgi:uncharacterized protein Yka (UPF0111/DUF47 family)